MPIDPASELGPQFPKDPPFTARMRLHQSWYRANVLKVPYGTGPKPSNTTYYGNMLTPADGEKGLNFLTPHIFAVAKRRLAEKNGTIDAFRLLCNMLSSQPMCFNLFGPLVDDLDLATTIFRTLLPTEIAKVTKVYLEYAPEPSREYLDDRTAFDAFVEYSRPDGRRAFIGVETKLTESFSQKGYIQPKYWQWTKREESPWPESAWPKLIDAEINQTWRDHLLVEAMLQRPQTPYTSGCLLVVNHPSDEPCIRTIGKYKALLNQGATPGFISISLDELVHKWKMVVTRKSEQEWLDNFHSRYLDLSLSDVG